MNNKDVYFVAVKVFLENDGKLLILEDGFGDWDLPGGRIKKDEFDVSFEQVVARKISEELGDDVKYTLGKPVVHMRHERIESSSDNLKVRIFAVGYSATYDGGNIQLTSHHRQMLWVDLNTFKPEEYFTGGWLKGVKEYLLKHKH